MRVEIRRRIEVVITGRTRNALGRNPPWVRIPPSAPKRTVTFCGCFLFFVVFVNGIRTPSAKLNIIGCSQSERWAEPIESHRLRKRRTITVLVVVLFYFVKNKLQLSYRVAVLLTFVIYSGIFIMFNYALLG